MKTKSPLMHLCILALWAGCMLRFDPELILLFSAATTTLQYIIIAVFIALLNLFWLFGCYHLMLAVFTFVAWMQRPSPPPSSADCPAIAILYTTKDDFQETAVLSCVEQNYPNFRVFILDDSLTEVVRERVDRFASQHPDKTEIVQRRDRSGFKAGNLNNALRENVNGYPYFVIADADSIFPSNFLTELLPFFRLSPDIGFVQANHYPSPHQETSFARDLCLQILPVWNLFFGPKNRYGFVPFLGHGGMLRYDVWQAIGGFPEIVAEDLAFSTRAAQLGFRGHFAHRVVAFEEFPASYTQFRKQQQKYVTGLCEFLHKEIGSILRSRRVTWFEKFDVLMAAGSLLLPAFFLVFLLFFCVVMPWQFGVRSVLTMEWRGDFSISVPVLMLESAFFKIGSWEYLLLTGVCTLAPGLGAIRVACRYPIRGTRMLLLSAVPFMSLMVSAMLAAFSYALFRRAIFNPTGGRLQRGFGWRTLLTEWAELFVGTLLIFMCVFTLNLCLLAFALSIWLGPLLQRVRWESPMLRPILYLPFFLVLGGLIIGATNLLAAEGSITSIFFIRF